MHPEQELYIQRLSDQNKDRNALYTKLLLALPVLAALPYIPTLIRPGTAFPSLLAISSLLSTAYMLRRMPDTVTGIAPLDAWTGTGGVAGAGGRSPLDTHLPYLNGGLAVMLGLMGVVAARRAGAEGGLMGWPTMGYLPGLVYGTVLMAKMMMASVDPEKALSGLKYGYKGA